MKQDELRKEKKKAKEERKKLREEKRKKRLEEDEKQVIIHNLTSKYDMPLGCYNVSKR